MGRRSDIDWEKIEHLYCLNSTTEVDLAKMFGVSRQAIQQRAKKHNWQKDLTKAVEIATKAALIEDAKLNAEKLGTEIGKRLAEGKISAVEAAVEARVHVIKSHQDLAAASKNLLTNLLSEVAEVTAKPVEIEALVLAVGQDDPAAASAVAKMAALPNRVSMAKMLIEAAAKNSDMERKAHGIKDDVESKDSIVDDMLLKLHNMTQSEVV